MRLTRLPVPDGYLLGHDQDGYSVLELLEVDARERRVYRTLRTGARDRYDALTWLYRYLSVGGLTPKPTEANKETPA